MAGRRPQPPPVVPVLSVNCAEDPRQVQQAMQQVTSQAIPRDRLRADLVVGSNHLRHGLRRSVEGFSVTATIADASSAYAIDESNPHPELEVWITVIGVAQPRARIEVW